LDARYDDPSSFEVKRYPMRSLDSLAASDPSAFGGVEMVKLDVQGAELEVGRGSQRGRGEQGWKGVQKGGEADRESKGWWGTGARGSG